MKKLKFLFILLFGNLLCTAQHIKGTFQGEIEGSSPVLIHINAKDGIVNGFFKNPSDSTISPLKGTIDLEGKITLKGRKGGYPSFSGILQGKLIEGSFTPKKRTQSQPFYAINLRGTYKSNCNWSSYAIITLSEKGYVLEDGLNNTENYYLVSTHKDDKGIYLKSSLLNAKLYPKDETLLVDTLNGYPSFIHRCLPIEDALTFTIEKDAYMNSYSFIEFPETDEEGSEKDGEVILNDSISFVLKRIPKSEYIVAKWMFPHKKTYKEITDINKIEKILKKEFKFIPSQYNEDTDEWQSARVEITYKDKKKETLDYGGEKLSDYFREYYPDLGILILEEEAGGDKIIDLNDSNKYRVGHPNLEATSPDGQLRIGGYYPGGAADCDYWFLEKWNPSSKKYEFIIDINHPKKDVRRLMPYYMEGFFWIDNNTVLFHDDSGGIGNYYEISVVIK